MAENHSRKRVVVAATPTHTLLPHLLHELSHDHSLEITVLTQPTLIAISRQSNNHHALGDIHHHEIEVSHIQMEFAETELQVHLANKDALIFCFSGADIQLSNYLIDAASAADISCLIPSEYGFDTSNDNIREALPPYQTRLEIQKKLRSGKTQWKAIYSGIVLEEAMKENGVLGLDLQWGSASILSGCENTKVPFSTYDTISHAIVEAILRPDDTRNEQHVCSFVATPNEVIELVEKHLEKKLDRYEYDSASARKEAAQRIKLGFFDGGVSLMSKVATWDPDNDAWARWPDGNVTNRPGWENKVRQAVDKTIAGGAGANDCGC